MGKPGSNAKYSTSELLAILLSREFTDGDIGSAGVNGAIPMAAMRLAQLTRCPNLGILCSYTGFLLHATSTKDFPLYPSNFDYRNIAGAESCVPSPEIFNFKRDFFCASGIQIDRYGNVNMVAVGDWKKPKFRGPGSAGIPYVSAIANKYLLYFPQQTPKVFVEKVDFISGIGFYKGSKSRDQFDLPGSGPQKVFTDLGIYDFDPVTKTMRLNSIHPDVTKERIHAATGFLMQISPTLCKTENPTENELFILRTKVDPTGILQSDK